MSIRNFWLIFLKVIGLYFLYNAIASIPSLTAIPMMFKFNEDVGEAYVTAIILLFGLVLIFGVTYLFIFRTPLLINWLRLEDDFSEDNELQLDAQVVTVLTLSTVIVGGLLVINGLPALVKEIINFSSSPEHIYGIFDEGAQPGWMMYYAVQIGIGIFLIIKSKRIVAFIERFKKDEVHGGTDENEPLDAE